MLRSMSAALLLLALLAGCRNVGKTSEVQAIRDPDPSPGIHQLRITKAQTGDKDISLVSLADGMSEICGPDQAVNPKAWNEVDPATGDRIASFSCSRVFPENVVQLAKGERFPEARFPVGPGLKRSNSWITTGKSFNRKQAYLSLMGSATVAAMKQCHGPAIIANHLVGIEEMPLEGHPGQTFTKVHVAVDYRCADERGAKLALH